jgi:excisionase family DNA binding protein
MDRDTSSVGQSLIPPTDPAAPLAIGDELMTVNDAARFLRVTVSWVYEHTRNDADDRLPFVKIGKYVRFDRTDLREYIDAKRQASRNGGRRR